MSKCTSKLALTGALLATAVPAFAQQNPQTVNIPISRPGEPVYVEIEIQSAYIEVVGESRDDVMFEVSVADGQRRIVTPSGTQLLKGGAYSLEVEEDDNKVYLDADWRADKVTVLARVPRQANLALRTINDGEIIVSSVEGNLELSNVNGPITARKISGSVIAEAVNDSIDVRFDRIDDAHATSLESINGDLYLGIPADAGVQVHLDTARGEIYSDFEVEVAPSEPTIEREDGDGGSAIRIESVIIAKVNGGGPIVRMKGLYGDIHIKKVE